MRHLNSTCLYRPRDVYQAECSKKGIFLTQVSQFCTLSSHFLKAYLAISVSQHSNHMQDTMRYCRKARTGNKAERENSTLRG